MARDTPIEIILKFMDFGSDNIEGLQNILIQLLRSYYTMKNVCQAFFSVQKQMEDAKGTIC